MRIVNGRHVIEERSAKDTMSTVHTRKTTTQSESTRQRQTIIGIQLYCLPSTKLLVNIQLVFSHLSRDDWIIQRWRPYITALQAASISSSLYRVWYGKTAQCTRSLRVIPLGKTANARIKVHWVWSDITTLDSLIEYSGRAAECGFLSDGLPRNQITIIYSRIGPYIHMLQPNSILLSSLARSTPPDVRFSRELISGAHKPVDD